MPQEIHARLYSNGQCVRLRWKEGVIASVEPSSAAACAGLWLAPVLVDLQVNGYAGVDFQRDDLTEADLAHAARELRAAGCGKFLLTLVTDDWPSMMRRLRRLRILRQMSHGLDAAIAGWHLEGPFLSPEPGFCGAHDPNRMSDPTPARIRELREITRDDPVLLTLAPERAGSIEAIALATSLGMRVSLGHTNASTEVLRKAVHAGAVGFTHLGNACPQLLDRHDNILWRVLDTPGLQVSLIPDRIHVAPALFRLAHRALAKESIYYTTDAMAAAGAAPGCYTIGQTEVEVGADQIVRQPGRSNFAGSALRPADAIWRAAQMLGRPWQEVWEHYSVRPAQLMGWQDRIAPGQPADFCLLRVSEAGEYQGLQTYFQGLNA